MLFSLGELERFCGIKGRICDISFASLFQHLFTHPYPLVMLHQFASGDLQWTFAPYSTVLGLATYLGRCVAHLVG